MIGILQFGGSNCDRDVAKAFDCLGVENQLIWYKDEERVDDCDGIVIPGGFSYGDYLRAGSIAARSPVMERVRSLADDGAPVLGICNGAQILCESRVVPGAYARNLSAKFQCEWTNLRVETTDSPFTRNFAEGEVVEIPIAHAEGRYVAEDPDALDSDDRVLFRYVDSDGEPTDGANPNGSDRNIAGVLGDRNVGVMMPHPERASSDLLGSDDGLRVLEGMAEVAQT
ncbi:MAG: phosphoribosylformylglycinamidine synthase I [Halobacteria archaeon]|nr:phosphoribosylformylglycinamidine synthase I [Halobacteria archaeon]